MTFEEIQAEIDKMPAALLNAAWPGARVEFEIRSNQGPRIYMTDGKYGNDSKSEFIGAETPEEAIEKAWEFIKALPDPQTTILSNYSRKLADAIDYGHENNVPGKLVDPVRRAQKAVSDMLLPAPTGEAS